MDRQRREKSVHRFPGHEKGDHGQDDRASKSAQHSNLSRAETVERIGGMPAAEIISDRGDEKRGDVRAHVPAIDQQRHRVEGDPGRDLEHHHGGRYRDDVRAPLGRDESSAKSCECRNASDRPDIRRKVRLSKGRVSIASATLRSAQPRPDENVNGHQTRSAPKVQTIAAPDGGPPKERNKPPTPPINAMTQPINKR
jgi:hypothetical protein